MRAHGLLQPRGAIAVAIFVTLVALAENSIAPWAPYYGAYALIVTLLPLVLRTPRFGPIRAVPVRHWILALACGLGMQLVAGLWDSAVFRPLAVAFGVDRAALDTPYWSFGAALGAIFDKVGGRWHADPARLLGGYLIFIVAWAGFGEEVFYRGYLQEVLARGGRLRVAIAVSTAFFAVRHATQLALLAPQYPWGAAASWLVIATLFGVVCALLYARTRSLWPPLLAHYVFNLVPAIAGIAGSN